MIHSSSIFAHSLIIMVGTWCPWLNHHQLHRQPSKSAKNRAWSRTLEPWPQPSLPPIFLIVFIQSSGTIFSKSEGTWPPQSPLSAATDNSGQWPCLNNEIHRIYWIYRISLPQEIQFLLWNFHLLPRNGLEGYCRIFTFLSQISLQFIYERL